MPFNHLGHTFIMRNHPNLSAQRSRSFLLRLLPEQFERLEEVYAYSVYKSKQKMGEEMLMEAVEKLAKRLGI